LPANEGRGYVLRRLLRRAVRFSQSLKINEPFLYKLVDIVAEIMEPYYPNVKEQSDFIKKVVKSEEDRFHETLEEGLAILNTMMLKAKVRPTHHLFYYSKVRRIDGLDSGWHHEFQRHQIPLQLRYVLLLQMIQ